MWGGDVGFHDHVEDAGRGLTSDAVVETKHVETEAVKIYNIEALEDEGGDED